MGAVDHRARGPHPRVVFGVGLLTVLPAIVLAGADHRAFVLMLAPAPLFALLGVDWLRSRGAWMRFVRMRAERRWYDALLLGGAVWPRSDEYFAPERMLGAAAVIGLGCVFAAIGVIELIDWL